MNNPKETTDNEKKFVLDTNVLLHNSNCIFDFEDNDLVLPIEVIDELTTSKGKRMKEAGMHGRSSGRWTNSALKADWETAYRWQRRTLQVLCRYFSEQIEGLAPDIMDNRILRAANFLQAER
jgi:predicted ribonuclease YlaK